MSGLEELLNADPKTQLTVIATKVYKMDEKLDSLCKDVKGLLRWKIRVVAMTATIGTVVGFILKMVL